MILLNFIFYNARVFVIVSLFHLLDKARHLEFSRGSNWIGYNLRGRLLAFTENIRIGWK
jgi:hypothetical protein